MIRTIAVTEEGDLLKGLSLDELKQTPDLAWYWVDFVEPDERESLLLRDHFQFHPLAIEDCFHFLQRPKADHYEGYHFFVLHALNTLTLDSEEVDLFVGKNFIVSFHMMQLREIEAAWQRVLTDTKAQTRGPSFIAYLLMDYLVDQYFPTIYQIEDQLDILEDNTKNRATSGLMDQVFDIRGDLLKIRRTIVPMRDLLYRIINSDRFDDFKTQRVYLTDVHDHLLKLSEMIEGNRELTADLRDSYLSINSNRMNKVMMTLTMITTIFMPLTLIAGIYGMNFENMPELSSPYGYYTVIGVMAAAGISMYLWFRRKGWFEA